MPFRVVYARLLASAAALVIAAGLLTGPVAASSAKPVKIPSNAAEWAAYSPSQKTAVMDWVWAQEAQMKAAGTWKWTDATSSATVTPMLTLAGGVDCGIKTNQFPWGTYATGWSDTWTNQSVHFLETGDVAPYNNKFWHNSTLYSAGWIAAGGGTYEYGESGQDFKFSWDSVTWSVQTWGSATTVNGAYWLFKDKYCSKTVTG